MGNIFQCFRRSSQPAVKSPSPDEGSIIPSSPAVMGSSHGEGSSLPLSSPQPAPIIPSSPPSIPTTSTPPLSIDSLKLRIQEVDPTDQIEPLISFIDYQLQRIKGSEEEASSSSLLDSLNSTTNLAAQFMDTISKEAESLASTDVAKEMGSLALSGLKMVGEAHWIFLGLSAAASALERGVTMKSNVPDCIDLLQAIVFLAKDLKRFKEAMPDESGRLRGAVQIIVEGAIMCSDYINKGRLSRYWSATTSQAQHGKTNQSIRDIQSSLSLTLHLQVDEKTTELLQNNRELSRKATKHFDESPLKLLEFKPVGIEEKVEKVKALLDMEGTEPAQVVVLCGFGGVGKSTLAASVIQNLYQTQPETCAGFKFCRVIINDKTSDEISHVKELQQQIIYDFGGGRQYLRHSQEGHIRLQETMQNKSCLLFIDNVIDNKYVQQLLPKDLLWFKKSETMTTENMGKTKTKLRILITSRETNLKPEFNIPIEEDDVSVFSNEMARCLLREIILYNDGQFHNNFEEIYFMNAVADACRGVPILLSIYGRHLKDNRKEASYKEAIQSLRQGNLNSFADEDLSKQLFFVYSKLGEEDQEAFLDICMYFYGWEWNLACKILDEGRLEALQRKMLINKSDSGIVIVHDILRLMGEKEGKQTRISNFIEFEEALENGEENLKNVKGISIAGNESLVTVESKHLNSMWQSLRVLIIGDWVKLNGLPCNRSFKNMRYLSVGDTVDFPFKDASKLDGLKAFFNRSKCGMNLQKLPPSLKIISHHLPDLYAHSFQTLPLQRLPSLECFIVETKKLVKLPEEFGFPASLVDLQLNCCGQLPKEICNLAALERLILDKCDMESLPQGMGELKKLKHLSMQNCTKLASLPQELGLLSSMACLKLCGCTLLQYLPEDLGNLSALEELSMRYCENLRELPQRFGGLYSLRNLDLTGCISLKTLPESFSKLRIESLTLESLPGLESLPSCFGNMPCLSNLKFISCNSLSTLPSSFVDLKCLKTFEIRDCSNIVALPEDFGKLSLLSKMVVDECPKLQELPHGFQALPALKIFHLLDCSSFASLPSGFGELASLESLWLKGLVISSLPDGFGKLKRLDSLEIVFCLQIGTLSDDFESLPALTSLSLLACLKLDGAVMERIIKLQHCYCVAIGRSDKLIERWEERQEEEESPMVVCTEENFLNEKDWNHAARVGLLCGNCVEWDNTTEQLIERSTSMLLEEDTTVAVISLPLHMESHHHHLLQRLVDKTMEKANKTSTGRLRIVHLKRVKEKGETTQEEKKEEEDCFREILKSRPKGSCAIPSTDRRRHCLITYIFFNCLGYRADNKLACCMLNLGVDDKDHKFVELGDIFGEEDISGEAIQSSERSYKEDIISNRIGESIESVSSGMSSGTAGPLNESWFADFIQILKENSADHLIDSKLNQVPLDQLKSNVVGIFMSDLNTPEYLKLEQIYKELKSDDHNFKMIWIPLLKNEFYGLGTYTRAIQKMSWTVLPNPNMVKVERKNPLCIIYDQEGNIANQDALSAMMSWGIEAFPFTKSVINPIVSIMHTQSSLSFLFNKLNLVNKEVIENKLIFLYTEPPSLKLKMKFSLEQLEQVHYNVQIIYVGYLFEENCDITTLKDVYEDVVEEMHWPKLSFEDMVTFWYRCKFFCEYIGDSSNPTIKELKLLSEALYVEKRWLVVLDANGVVTRSGYEIVKMLCKTNDEKKDEVDVIIRNGLLESLSLGKCNQIIRKYFNDTIINHPKHPQHDLPLHNQMISYYYCDSCYFYVRYTWEQRRLHICKNCDWGICLKCWELFVKGGVKNSHQE